MERLTAEQAIEKIKTEKTTFMGIAVAKYSCGHEMRSELQRMGEKNEIRPPEYWKALKMTPKPESKALEKYEYGELA